LRQTDLATRQVFVLTVVPFEEVIIDFSGGSEERELACAPNALHRARKHFSESHASPMIAEAGRVVTASL
jgi:hypothetical protein